MQLVDGKEYNEAWIIVKSDLEDKKKYLMKAQKGHKSNSTVEEDEE